MIEPQLVSEIEIVHLIYTKYRAQQRTQRWWRFLAILHRRLIRMVQNNKVDVNSAGFIVHRLTPKAARAFHSILAQGAFISLGFALLAALARIRTLLEPYTESKEPKRHTIQSQVKLIASDIIDEDLGEVLDDNSSSARAPKSIKSSSKSLKPKKKKNKKSAHSAIDDIFG